MKAIAKTILFGEHAVVYKKAGIAVPLNELYTLINIKDDGAFLFNSNYDLSYDERNKVKELCKFLIEKLGIKDNIDIHIDSNFPNSSGLGSSASLSISLIRAFATKYKIKLSNDKINEIAFECEKIFHGTPSGIDNTVINYEKPTYFHNKKSEFLNIKKPLNLIIASTGKKSSTKEIVSKVRENYNKSDNHKKRYSKIFDEIHDITNSAKVALQEGDIKKIGELMTLNHNCLKKLRVSCKEADTLVKVFLENNAHGAKIVGAGKGGNVIGLVNKSNRNKVVKELKKISDYVISTEVR